MSFFLLKSKQCIQPIIRFPYLISSHVFIYSSQVFNFQGALAAFVAHGNLAGTETSSCVVEAELGSKSRKLLT